MFFKDFCYYRYEQAGLWPLEDFMVFTKIGTTEKLPFKQKGDNIVKIDDSEIDPKVKKEIEKMLVPSIKTDKGKKSDK